MELKKAFDIVIAGVEGKIVELKNEIDKENDYILMRAKSDELESMNNTLEYLKDFMIDHNMN